MTMRRTKLIVLAAAVLAFSAAILPAQATQPDAEGNHKVWVCHETSSETNEFVLVHIDEAGWLRGHDVQHEGDFVLVNAVDPTVADCDGVGG